MNGEIVALTPPVPRPINTMEQARPAIFPERVVTFGIEVMNSMIVPQRYRLQDGTVSPR